MAFLLMSWSALAGPMIFYSKKFPGSVPPYVQVTVAEDGSTVYAEDPKDDQPLAFRLSASDVKDVFATAARLDNFQKKIESGLKVANMGLKTFRYENGAEKHEQQFNYSTDEEAKLLLDFFERIVETERHFIDMERAVKFDRIGVNQALLDMAVAFERKRIVAPEQFLPLLDRIAKNDSFVHIARERAAAMADSVRNAQKPKTE
jgi:hypothetical protein